MQERRVTASEIDHEVVVEIILNDAPDIVFAEDLAIHLPSLSYTSVDSPSGAPRILSSVCASI
jgi:hypothetical protein